MYLRSKTCVFNSKLFALSKKTIFYKVLISPIITLYASETWTTTKTGEQNVAIFNGKVLRKIFFP